MADDYFDIYKDGIAPGGVPSKTASQESAPGEPRIAPVPENGFNVQDPMLLQLTEDWAGTVRVWEACQARVRLPGNFDAAHLRDIHAHVMQDVYTDSGLTRGDELVIATNKSIRDKTELAPQYDTRIGSNDEHITLLSPGKVNGRLDLLSELLERENHLQGLKKPAFIEKLADYYTQYSHASPFRAGNEHVLGVVLHQIGVKAGYAVHPGASPHLREVTDKTLHAGVASHKGNLMQVLSSITSERPGLEAQARRNPTQSALPLSVSEELKKRQAEEEIS